MRSWVPSLCFVILAGCTLHSYLPSNRFDFPETHGEWLWGRAQLQRQATTKIEMVPSFTDVPPATEQPKFRTTEKLEEQMSLTVEPGISKKLDLVLKMSFAPSPAIVALKYQFVGNTFDKREAGDFALSATLGGGFARQNSKDTSSAGEVRVQSQTWALDAAIIGGYRISRDIMFYGGPFYASYDYEGRIIQPITTFNIKGNGAQYGANAGIFVSFVEYGFALEWMTTSMRWTSAQNYRKSDFGLSLVKEF